MAFKLKASSRLTAAPATDIRTMAEVLTLLKSARDKLETLKKKSDESCHALIATQQERISKAIKGLTVVGKIDVPKE